MAEINLLPEEFKPSTYIVGLTKTLNRITVVFSALLVVASLSFTAAYLFYSQKNISLLKEKERLISEIKALEATEQRLILVKDRLQKISQILSGSYTESQIDSLYKLSNMIPPTTSLDSVFVEGNSVKISLSTPVLDDITNFISSLLASQNFKSIKLTSFVFDENKGYTVSFILNK